MSLDLKNVKDFALGTSSFERHISTGFICRDTAIPLRYEGPLSEIGAESHLIAFNSIREWLTYFDAERIRPDIVQDIQRELYSMRIGTDRLNVQAMKWDSEDDS